MALTRDLWLVLRARDEASRIVRSFGTTVGGTAASVSKNISQFDRTIADVSTRLDQFARTSMLVGTVMAGLGVAGVAFIKSAVDVAAEYDRQVRRTITQIDNVAISLEDIAEVGRRVAREVEIPFEQMQETLFFIFSSMDVNITQAETLLKGFAKEAVAGQTSIEAAARSNIAVLNALGLTTNDLGRIQDVMFQVVRKGIITYEELANVVGRALPATARAGQTFETLGAMIAFMTRNGLSAAMAATSAARALESFAHPKTVARLGEMGIKVRDVHGEFLPLVDVMEQMNNKLSKLSAPERAKALQELFTGAGGTIQARRFWDTAFKNFGQFEEMVGHMSNSAGVFESAYETMSGSVAAQSELLRNKWMLIKEALGRAVLPDFLKLINILGVVLDWFERLPPGTKTVISQFILWGSVISIVIGVLIVLVGTLAFFVASIMAAGTALVVILGVITGVTAALLGIGAAFFLAWQNSEGFRKIIQGMGDALSKAWNIVVQAAKKVKASFDENIRPSLERLRDVIENKATPAVNNFIKIWKDEVLPKIEEASSIITDLADKGFKAISDVIDNQVIPAVERLSEWWSKNKDDVKPLLEMSAQVVKWLLIITAVIGGLFVLAPIVTFVAAVATIITIFTSVYDWVKKTGKSVKEFFAGLGQTVSDAIGTAIDFVADIVKNGLDWLYNNIWKPFWDTFGGLIKEVWGLIGDVIKVVTTLIGEVIKDWIAPLIGIIVGGFNATLDKIKEVWNKITSAISTAIAFIRDNIVKPVVEAIKKIWNDNFAEMFNKAKDKFESIKDAISDRISDIKNFFKGAGTWLLDAGKNILQGLIDGITNKVKDLRNKLKAITDEIPNWKGPRAVDIRLLAPVGMNIMGGLISGIRSQVPMLKRELQGVTSQISQVSVPSFGAQANSQSSAPAENKTFNQYFTIHTQEIDPRAQAAELGWLLEGRM